MPSYRTGVVVWFDHPSGHGLLESESGAPVHFFRDGFGRFTAAEGQFPLFVPIRGYQRKVKVGSRVRYLLSQSYPLSTAIWGYDSDWRHAEKVMRTDPLIRIPKDAAQAEEWGWLYAGPALYNHEQEYIRTLVPEYRLLVLGFSQEVKVDRLMHGWVLPIWEVPREGRHEFGHIDHLGSYLQHMEGFQVLTAKLSTVLVQPPKGWTRHQEYRLGSSSRPTTIILNPKGFERVVITYDPDGYARATILRNNYLHDCTSRCTPEVRFPLRKFRNE